MAVSELANAQYSLVSAIDSQTLVYDANSPFVYVSDFMTDTEMQEAQVAVTEIPVDVKTKYYWNVSRSADGTGALLHLFQVQRNDYMKPLLEKDGEDVYRHYQDRNA